MSIQAITQLVTAITALIVAVGTLASHLQLRRKVHGQAAAPDPPVARDWQGR